MLNPTRIISFAAPQRFINLNNGKWYYNYDIKSEDIEVHRINENGEEEVVSETRWSFIQIKHIGKPEYEKCVKAIIRKYIDDSQEFDLINSANRVLLNLSNERTILSDYIDYLNLVDEIKTKVKEDFGM